ncbi:MAG: glycerol-3-phosphate acyltransferase [Chloroflexi bacterium]|nr:glycerol-3-phosphate acyltransferase [Chloroflexota bacterium]MCH7654156.1 glycerol-3-phosphate acyltransferase [Chloroflexota bacterium]
MTESIFTLLLAALFGSLPTAYILGRYVKGIDIRNVGSKNPGAVNAARSLGKGLGLLVLFVDAGKGALAVFIGQRLGAAELALYASAVLATLGHNFSPFLGFRGGKGGATVLGISALMLWQITAVTVAFGAVLFAVTRHPVWSLTGVFLLLNLLTIVTGQTTGLIVLCLVLSSIVAGTHLFRLRPSLIPAIRAGDWRRFMSSD